MKNVILIAITFSLMGCQSNNLKTNKKETYFGSFAENRLSNFYTPKNIINDDQAKLIEAKYFSVVETTAEGQPKYPEDWINQNFLKQFQAGDSTQKKITRNDMIDDLSILSDYYFHKYKTNMYTQQKATDTSFNTYSGIFTTAAALTTGGYTPNILSGIAGLFNAGRLNWNKGMYAEQTAESLINIMEANRLNKQREILINKQKSVDEYSLRSALRDLIIMHQEGNMISAIASLRKTTQLMQNTAEQNLEKTKENPKLTIEKTD